MARSLRCPQKSLHWLCFCDNSESMFPWRMSLIRMSCLSTNKQQIKGEAIDFFGATASSPESFHSCRGRRKKKTSCEICSYTPEKKNTLITVLFSTADVKTTSKTNGHNVSFSAYQKSVNFRLNKLVFLQTESFFLFVRWTFNQYFVHGWENGWFWTALKD